MKIDNEGKIHFVSRRAARICEEYGWNIIDMAWAIEELRDEVEKKDKEITRLEQEP